MKNFSLLLVFIFLVLLSCTSTKGTTEKNSLEGTWQLNYITGPRIAFEGLYPDKKPTIKFDFLTTTVSGNNSCNQYSGALGIDGKKINFKDAKMLMTMMACEGEGESVYMSTLNKIDFYTISPDGKTLSLMMGTVAMMRFSRQM